MHDIFDGLRQILDAYDGSIDCPHAKRKHSTDDKEDRSNFTDGQRWMAGQVDDIMERYGTHDKEEDSDSDHGYDRYSDI